MCGCLAMTRNVKRAGEGRGFPRSQNFWLLPDGVTGKAQQSRVRSASGRSAMHPTVHVTGCLGVGQLL